MNLFQTAEWEEFKLATGYQKSYRIDDILVLQKNLPMGRSMLYSPMVIKDQKSRIKDHNFISKVRDIGKNEKAVFYRLEIDDSLNEASSYRLLANSFVKSFEEMQPEHTLVLDITKPEEEILKQMKPKGRYNIKVAQKNQIKIVEEPDTNNFYKLYSNMAKRHGITYRNPHYFQQLFDILSSKGYCKVFTAFVKPNNEARIKNNGGGKIIGQTPVSSVIISLYKEKAIYLFGGSSDEHKNLMAPYLLQWEVIRTAKKEGCVEYDFFGIAPPNKPNHPWRGVTDFKKKFGGKEEEILGSWDLILRPFEYNLFKIVEKIRRG